MEDSFAVFEFVAPTWTAPLFKKTTTPPDMKATHSQLNHTLTVTSSATVVAPRNHRSRASMRWLLPTVIAAAAHFGGLRADAQIKTWNATGGGLWSDGTKWTPNGVPVDGDTARFSLSATYAVGSLSGTVATLNATAGNVTLNGTVADDGGSELNVTSGITVSGGNLTVRRVTFNTSATITVSGGTLAFSEGFGLANTATATVSTGGTLSVTGDSVGSLAGSAIVNLAGGTFSAPGNSAITLSDSAKISGFGTISGTLYQLGINDQTSVTVTGGNLNVVTPADGFFNVNVLNLGSNQLLLNDGAYISTLNVARGTISSAAPVEINTLTGFGTIDAPGNIEKLTATGNLTLGVDTSADGYAVNELTLGSNTLTLKGLRISDIKTGSIAGGTINSANGVVIGRSFSGFGTVNGIFDADLGSVISTSGGNLTVGDATAIRGFATDGILNVGTVTVTLRSASFADLGFLTTLSGGTIVAANGIALASGTNVIGSGTINGAIAGSIGSSIDATGNLSLGSATAFDGFYSDGRLNVRNNTVTLQDRDKAVLGTLTTLGNATAGGTLSASNGVILQAGKALTGFGTVNNAFENQGHVNGEGNVPADKILFTGAVTGRGSFTGNVTFGGTFDPGNSPARVMLENVGFEPTSTLNLEIGGLRPGADYDVLSISGAAAFSGTIQFSLINSFVPAVGNSFTVLEFGSRTGNFTAYTGTTLGGGLFLQPQLLANSLVLTVVPEPNCSILLGLGSLLCLVRRRAIRRW